MKWPARKPPCSASASRSMPDRRDAGRSRGRSRRDRRGTQRAGVGGSRPCSRPRRSGAGRERAGDRQRWSVMNAIDRHTMNCSRSGTAKWELRLYVAGQSTRSVVAFANLKKLCEAYLAGKYRIEVIDLLENPQLSSDDQIVAIPTLVRQSAHSDPQDHRRSFQHREDVGRIAVAPSRQRTRGIMNEPKRPAAGADAASIRRHIGCVSMSVARHRARNGRSRTSRRSARNVSVATTSWR